MKYNTCIIEIPYQNLKEPAKEIKENTSKFHLDASVKRYLKRNEIKQETQIYLFKFNGLEIYS
jgi:hypothetical protein